MTTLLENFVSPRTEMLSWETLWALPDKTSKSIADLFREHAGRPSELLERQQETTLVDIERVREDVERFISPLRGFSVCINGTFQYPLRLRDARHPPEVLYYRGDLSLLETPCISVVGTRNPTEEGKRRAAKIAKMLVKEGFTIVSGLAKGIDTAAMTAALEAGGRTIGVIGTPILESYPKENRELQERVASDHLLLSHVPFYRYANEPFASRRRYFPERNETMAAISLGTVIVEAAEGSGTLTQARAALQQGRKLFILDSLFNNPMHTWPQGYADRGAIRVRGMNDILDVVKRPQRDVDGMD